MDTPDTVSIQSTYQVTVRATELPELLRKTADTIDRATAGGLRSRRSTSDTLHIPTFTTYYNTNPPTIEARLTFFGHRFDTTLDALDQEPGVELVPSHAQEDDDATPET